VSDHKLQIYLIHMRENDVCDPRGTAEAKRAVCGNAKSILNSW
jgi:hypothetical protein